MFVFKSTYDKVVQKLDDAEKMNQQLQLEVQRLAEEISAQNTDCQVGAWCKDCRHIRYDRAVIAKSDVPYGYYAKKLINGNVMYCSKHLHDLCPEHSKNESIRDEYAKMKAEAMKEDAK